MKTLSVSVLILAVFFTCEADAGSFNLSGSFDPGFTIGHGRYERRHKVRVEEAENNTNDDNPDLPSVAEAKHFKIPDVFTQAKSTREVDAESWDNKEESRHHGRSHHRVYRH